MAENNKIPPPPPDDDDVIASSKTVPPPPPDDEPVKKKVGTGTVLQEDVGTVPLQSAGALSPSEQISQSELPSQSGTTEPTGIPKISPETKKRIEDITEIKLPELEPIDAKVPLLPEVEPPQYWVGGQEMSKEDFVKSLDNPDTIRKFRSGEIGINVKNDQETSAFAQQKFSDVPELEQKDGSLADRINTFAGNFLRGGVKTLVSEPLKALGEAETAFSRLFHRKVWGEQYADKVKIENDPFYKAGKFIEEKVLPVITYANPAYDNEFLTRDVAEGFGQGIAYLLTAPKTVAMEGIGLLKSSPKIASATKTALSEISKQTFSKPAVVGALNMASSEYEQAKAAADEARTLPEQDYINLKVQQGATPEIAKQQYDFLNSEAPEDIAFNVFIKSLPAGTIESFSAGRLLQRLDKVTGGSVKQTLATIGKNALEGGMDGFIQESIQQAYSNLTAQQTYDKTREIIDGVVRSGGAGATVQSTMNALAAVLGIKIKGAKTTLQKKTLTEAQTLVNNTIDEIESNINEAEKAVKEATGEKKQPPTPSAELQTEGKPKPVTDESQREKEGEGQDVPLTTKVAEGVTEVAPEGEKKIEPPTEKKEAPASEQKVVSEPPKVVSESKKVVSEEKEPEQAQAFDAAEQQSLKFTAPQTETERKKSFLETIKGSPMTTEELNKATEELNEFYNVLSNKEATKKADKEIEKSFAKAKEKVLSDSAPTAEKSVIALRLIKHYEKIGDYDSAVELIDAYDKQLREAGRFIQAASLWNKLSPESVLRVTDKVADKYGKKLKSDVRKTILKKLSEIDKMPEGIEKTEKTLEVLNYIADQFPPTLRELFDAYRYQNMLSNPRSHERNIISNLFNTFLIRPATLTSTATYDLFRSMFNPAARDYKFSDAPAYIKEAITAVPQAMRAFMEGFRSGKITDKLLETDGTIGAIEAARQSKIPKYLTVAVRLMEAQDRFFTALISQGEKGRLMSQGIDEKIAQEKGIKLAEKYFYREKLGLNDEEINVISRALSSLGNYISKGRNIPYVGGVYSWFVPFVRTPINVAKVAIEFTPLGLIGGKYGKEQVGTALLGTTIMGIGGLLAAQGLTAWTPPEEKKERELFYASGRKPFSIKIGDKWVPMIYFGPLSLSLAFPAAVKHFQDYTKTALTDGDIEQITEAIFSMAKFITSQTSVSSVDGFYKSIEGDIDTKSGKVLGFTTTQAIPFSGLVRWINMWLDPIYRKVTTKPFWESYLQSIEKDLPVLSKDLEPYPTPSGKPAEREPSSTWLPWDIGFSNKDYDILLEKRRNLLQKREKRKEKKEDK